MSDTVLRQIEMLRMLPRQGKITPQQLQKRLADIGYLTTERTVQRDLMHLSRTFSLECDNSSKPHGWRWGKNMVAFDLAGLSTAEALAFQMLSQFGSDLLPPSMAEQLQPYFMVAKRQLSLDVGPRLARNWTKKVRVAIPNQPLLPAKIAKDVMGRIHVALMEERCLAIRYRSDTAPFQTVHPLGLVQHGATFYLVVHYDGFTDIRLLAVPRIHAAEPVDKPCKTPEGFNLDSYIASGGMGFGEIGQTIRLEMKMYGGAAEHLKETWLSEDQKIYDTGPGEALVKATVQLTRRLRWWLLGFGADVQVIKPAALRNEIRNKLRQSLSRYDE
ncbi:MAG TPA: WYL domain-containing protein [Noviherbaspirillum sp.]|nr:WYL domain-containing protein [Noviherbaspirillum sp.]